MKKTLAVIFSVLICPAMAAEPLSLGGVEIGMSLEEAISVRGEPDSSEAIQDWFDLKSVFGSLTVYSLGDQQVVGLRSASPDDCTADQLCPLQELDSAGGPRGRTVQTNEGRRHVIHVDGDYCATHLIENSGLITAIEVVCSPD